MTSDIVQVANADNSLPALAKSEAFAAAYREYLTTDDSLAEIAITNRLDVYELALWAKEGKWAERKKAMVDEVLTREETAFREWFAENRLKEIKADIAAVQTARSVVTKYLEQMKDQTGKMDTLALSRLANSIETLAQTANRALGLENALENSIPQGAKHPLINLNVSGGVAVSKDPIEVKPE